MRFKHYPKLWKPPLSVGYLTLLMIYHNLPAWRWQTLCHSGVPGSDERRRRSIPLEKIIPGKRPSSLGKSTIICYNGRVKKSPFSLAKSTSVGVNCSWVMFIIQLNGPWLLALIDAVRHLRWRVQNSKEALARHWDSTSMWEPNKNR